MISHAQIKTPALGPFNLKIIRPRPEEPSRIPATRQFQIGGGLDPAHDLTPAPFQTMILPPSDAQDFFRLIKLLDAWFRLRLPRHSGPTLAEIRDLRAEGFADPANVRNYVSQNTDGLPPEEMETISAWQRHGIAARFLVYKHGKDGHLFSHSAKQGGLKLYQVQGLTQPIDELVPFFPCYVETRLLPFRGRIVTDGIMAPVRMHFSSRMVREFTSEVKEHIARHGLITTLPPEAPAAPDDAALLRHYLSTAANRRDYARQISALRQQSAALNIQYLQQTGKQHSKALKASLIQKGLTHGFFAVLEDTIITGAPTKPAAALAAAELLPPGLQQALVWIKL